jgi:iron complex outermembrane receptor protein
VPKLTANANVEWDVPAVKGLTLTGRVVATGEQAVDAANTLEIGGWTRFDLGARYVALAGGRPLTLRAGVDNIANRRYWASAFETFGTSLLQGQPRTVRFSASLDL